MDVQKMYSDLLDHGRKNGEGGLANETVRRIHNVLHGAFRQAVREGLLQRNVIDATEPPKQVKQEVKPLTREKVDGFLAASREDRLHALFVTAVGTAMRRGELLALQWNCVDLVKGKITSSEP